MAECRGGALVGIEAEFAALPSAAVWFWCGRCEQLSRPRCECGARAEAIGGEDLAGCLKETCSVAGRE